MRLDGLPERGSEFGALGTVKPAESRLELWTVLAEGIW